MNRTPYRVLVSEFMLQQTQVVTVRAYYERWMKRFPDVGSLAAASEREVMELWQGLGYYARARNLHKTAQVVMDEFGGKFPDAVEKLQKLPGVGRYTAGAVASFAFGQAVPIVDANIARVLARVFNFREAVDQPKNLDLLWGCAEELVPKEEKNFGNLRRRAISDAAEFNEGMMELGATYCRSGQPDCLLCPIREFCQAEVPESLPVKKARRKQEKTVERYAWDQRARRVYLELGMGSRWRGLWRLPQDPDLASEEEELPEVHLNFSIMHYQVRMEVRRKRVPETEHGRWFPISELHALPLPAPHRRAIQRMIEG